MRAFLIFTAFALNFACRPSAEAPPEFSDAVRFLFSDIESDESSVASAMTALETQIYENLEMDGPVLKRSLEPERISATDVAGIEHPDRDPQAALPTAVAYLSDHVINDHHQIQLMDDQRPVEPQSQKHFYDRTFLEGEDCWEDAGCTWLRTVNDLVKENALLEVEYAFNKDFRWVDLTKSPDFEGDESEPRWGYVGRSWTTKVYSGDADKVHLLQSYTTEVWIPRDGRGYLGDSHDSEGGGVLRMLCLWAETDLGFAVSEDLVVGTTRFGIDENFEATDEYLSDPSR